GRVHIPTEASHTESALVDDTVGFVEIEMEAAGWRAHDERVGKRAVFAVEVFESCLADLAFFHVAIDDYEFGFCEREAPIAAAPRCVHLAYLQRIVGREFEV